MIRIIVLSLACVLSLAASAHAGFCHGCARWHGCEPSCCAPACGWTTVERTVLVPEYYREKKMMQFTDYRPEPYVRTYTVWKAIPEAHTETRACTVLVPKRTVRTEAYTVCRPVYRTVTQQCTVMVPHQEPAPKCCGACGNCGHCGECMVTVCRPEVRTRTVQVCDYVYEQKTREVPCVEMVCEVQQKTVTLTHTRYEPEQKTMTCLRMTPVLVEREVEVPACRMVEKKITCCVPACASGCCF